MLEFPERWIRSSVWFTTQRHYFITVMWLLNYVCLQSRVEFRGNDVITYNLRYVLLPSGSLINVIEK